MADPFVAEIRIFPFNFAPKGWAWCDGQVLPLSQNTALFSLLGTTYGGNGQTTFALPDLRGRVPMHMGNKHTLGETAGTESVTLTIQTMPQHLHFMQANSNDGDQVVPLNNYMGPGFQMYGSPANLTTLLPASVSNYGGSQAHTNQEPYLVLNFCIALQGIFPSQN